MASAIDYKLNYMDSSLGYKPQHQQKMPICTEIKLMRWQDNHSISEASFIQNIDSSPISAPLLLSPSKLGQADILL